MPTLPPNAKVIQKALNGVRGQYTIDKHPGLFLASRGDGNGSWRIRYRSTPGAQQEWHTLTNDARNTQLEDVFNEASRLLSAVKLLGVTPKAEKAKSQTFGDIYNQWLERHAKSTRSWEVQEALYRRHIEARLGKIVLADLTKRKIIEALDEIKDASTGVKGGYGYQANRAQIVISSILSWAAREDIIETNPARDIKKRVEERQRSRVLSDEELRAIWAALDGEAPANRRAFQLALLLGQRRGEVAGACRSEMTRDGWLLPPPRTKNKRTHFVPLPPLAAAIFKEAFEATKSTFAFPALEDPSSHVAKQSLSRAWKRVVDNLNIPDLHLHDCRHAAATGMAAIGVPLEIREIVQNQVTRREKGLGSVYDQHEYKAEKLRALTMWQSRLLAIVSGQPIPTARW
jgi:integrase